MNNKTTANFYLAFYTPKNKSVTELTRPLVIAQKAIMKADKRAFDTTEALAEVVAGQLLTQLKADNLQAVIEFAKYFADEVFAKAFNGDRAKLNGRQFDLLKNACAVEVGGKDD